ncbi:hypothetical protein OHB35_51330 [Streptomyces phaeochromogenes]|uniref:Uncharacterized protein n=1 Tax=Streptomyces phaeochromogenes TaxID=1923 RepID=A0ABZ1HQU6_STRPH|nr:hypothetical protein [Streptomyces phaeochromogenes]WSD20971.1 hypothetical protein OHB35_51330 [Streptomyces phaeochromogenes]
MPQAELHLAFDGFGVREASSDAFFDNHPPNRVSHALGYVPNGVTWDTRRGEPAEVKQWRLTRKQWIKRRCDGIELVAVGDCPTSPRDWPATS